MRKLLFVVLTMSYLDSFSQPAGSINFVTFANLNPSTAASPIKVKKSNWSLYLHTKYFLFNDTAEDVTGWSLKDRFLIDIDTAKYIKLFDSLLSMSLLVQDLSHFSKSVEKWIVNFGLSKEKIAVMSIREILLLSAEITVSGLSYKLDNEQLPVDKVFERGYSDCDGYARLNAAVFNTLKIMNPKLCNVFVKTLGSLRLGHVWNEVIVVEQKNGSLMYTVSHIDPLNFEGRIAISDIQKKYHNENVPVTSGISSQLVKNDYHAFVRYENILYDFSFGQQYLKDHENWLQSIRK